MTAPTPTSNTIPADDRRNPSYYEMMAGYEKPNLEWYMSEDEEGNRSRPKFTKENFVRGWRIQCGRYYRLREVIAAKVLQRDMHLDIDRITVQWTTEEIVEELLEVLMHNGRCQDVPAYWRHCMLKDLVGKVVGWVKKHQLYLEEGQIPNLPRRATWVWGPHRKSPVFQGMFQLQHMKIVINVPDDFVRIAVRDIVDVKDFAFAPVDVHLSKIIFSKLEAALQAIERSTYTPASHSLYYSHPDNEDMFQVLDDRTLQSALIDCQKPMDDEVSLLMILKKNEMNISVFGRKDTPKEDRLPRKLQSPSKKKRSGRKSKTFVDL